MVLHDWGALGTKVQLEVWPSLYRAYVSVLLDYIHRGPARYCPRCPRRASGRPG